MTEVDVYETARELIKTLKAYQAEYRKTFKRSMPTDELHDLLSDMLMDLESYCADISVAIDLLEKMCELAEDDPQ